MALLYTNQFFKPHKSTVADLMRRNEARPIIMKRNSLILHWHHLTPLKEFVVQTPCYKVISLTWKMSCDAAGWCNVYAKQRHVRAHMHAQVLPGPQAAAPDSKHFPKSP